MFNILKSTKTEDITAKKEIAELSLKVEIQEKRLKELSADIEKVRLVYQNWLEEKEATIKELKNRIEKKINYVQSKETKQSLNDLIRQRALRRMGLGREAKDLYISTDIDKEQDETQK